MDAMDDLRQRILGKRDAREPALRIEIPEWGETVAIRRLTLTERLAFEMENGAINEINRKTERERYVRWLVRYTMLAACDDAGARLFHPEDEETLAGKSATAIERLALGALKANNVTAEEIAALGKPSGEAPNGASPSASPATLV